MYQDKKILCIIPARGGSKRLPGKNIKPLLGKPLIAYAIGSAKGSTYVDRVVVSTDDESIASVAKEYGAEVPFMRPTELASDQTPITPVLQHAVKVAETNGELFDFVMVVQPTSPGVTPEDIDAAVRKIISAETTSCITLCEITDRPEWMYSLDGAGRLSPYTDAAYKNHEVRSQELPKLYRINGAVYLVRRDTLMNDNLLIDKKNCVGVLMPRERSVDIDTEQDFALAEILLARSR